MQRLMLVTLAAAAAAAGSVRPADGAAPRACGSLSVGPGSLTRGSQGGAACLLRAYHTCTPAVYTLSSFGVDTIARSTFTVEPGSQGCSVRVVSSFRVVPQPWRPPRPGRCRTIARLRGDIVARGCRGASLPPTVSLTGRGPG